MGTTNSKTGPDTFEQHTAFSMEGVEDLKRAAKKYDLERSFEIVEVTNHGRMLYSRFLRIPKNTAVIFYNPQGKLEYRFVENKDVFLPYNQQVSNMFFLIQELISLKKMKGDNVTISDIKIISEKLRNKMAAARKEREKVKNPERFSLYKTDVYMYTDDDLVCDASITKFHPENPGRGFRTWQEYLNRSCQSRLATSYPSVVQYARSYSRGVPKAGERYTLGTLLSGRTHDTSNKIHIYVLSVCLGIDEFCGYDFLSVKPGIYAPFKNLFHDCATFFSLSPQAMSLSMPSLASEEGHKIGKPWSLEDMKQYITQKFVKLNQDQDRYRKHRCLKNLELFQTYTDIFFQKFTLGLQYSQDSRVCSTHFQCYHRYIPTNSFFHINYNDLKDDKKPLPKNIVLDGYDIPVRDAYQYPVDWGYANFSLQTTLCNFELEKQICLTNGSSRFPEVFSPEKMYYLGTSQNSKVLYLILHKNAALQSIEHIVKETDFPSVEMRRVIFTDWTRVMLDTYVDDATSTRWPIYMNFMEQLFVDGKSLKDIHVGERYTGGKHDGVEEMIREFIQRRILFILSGKEVILKDVLDLTSSQANDFVQKYAASSTYGYYYRDCSFPYFTPLEFMIVNYIFTKDQDTVRFTKVGPFLIEKARENIASLGRELDKSMRLSPLAAQKIAVLLEREDQPHLVNTIVSYLADARNMKQERYLQIVELLPQNYCLYHLPPFAVERFGARLSMRYIPRDLLVQISKRNSIFSYLKVSFVMPLIFSLETFIKEVKFRWKEQEFETLRMCDIHPLYVMEIVRPLGREYYETEHDYPNVETYSIAYLTFLEDTLRSAQKDSYAALTASNENGSKGSKKQRP